MSVRAAPGDGGTNDAHHHHNALVPCLAALSLAESEPTGMKRMAAREAMRARDEQEFYAQAKQVSKVREAARQLAAARVAEQERKEEARRERGLYHDPGASFPLAPQERKLSDALARKEARLAQEEAMEQHALLQGTPKQKPKPAPMPAPAPAEAGPSAAAPPLPPNTYYVEAILDERRWRGKLQYLVKWLGYDNPDDNTWEYAENVTWGAQDAIKAYEQAKKKYTGVRVTYKNPHGW